MANTIVENDVNLDNQQDSANKNLSLAFPSNLYSIRINAADRNLKQRIIDMLHTIDRAGWMITTINGIMKIKSLVIWSWNQQERSLRYVAAGIDLKLVSKVNRSNKLGLETIITRSFNLRTGSIKILDLKREFAIFVAFSPKHTS